MTDPIPTTVQVATCDQCHGAGERPHERAGEAHQCFSCDGVGIVKKGGYGRYRTRQMAARMLAQGKAKTCEKCQGSGTDVWPAMEHCYSCREGKVVVAALPGQSWGDAPRGVKYESARDEVMAGYAAAVHVNVVAQNRAGTWNEAHLGLGSITSVTDYGRTWDAMVTAAQGDALPAAIEALQVKAREHLKSCQWIKLTTPDDTLANELIVLVHRNGYTLVAREAREPNVMLPPTYTPEVLNAPVI